MVRLLMNGPAMAGILTVFHACLDLKQTVLDKYHYLLYYLSVAMNPRYLYLVDNELNPVRGTVRVGLAVETVGQPGRPKTITGFQVSDRHLSISFSFSFSYCSFFF
jgi:26S proteasome regulatory subunit N1